MKNLKNKCPFCFEDAEVVSNTEFINNFEREVTNYHVTCNNCSEYTIEKKIYKKMIEVRSFDNESEIDIKYNNESRKFENHDALTNLKILFKNSSEFEKLPSQMEEIDRKFIEEKHILDLLKK